MADRELPSWVIRLGVALALTGLVVWSFVQRWDLLDRTPFPVGVDGYFYPVQLRSLLEHGTLQYPASPLAFYLLAPFAALTDPIVGAKLGAAFYGASIALPAYAVGKELSRGDRGAGLITAAIATSSAGSFYLSIEFVKNGIGLTVALTALWLVLRALRAPTRRAIIIAVIAIALAMLTHKMAAGLVLGIAVPAAIAEAHRRGKLKWRSSLVLGVAGAIAGVIVLAGLAMPERFISPGDLDLIDDLFTTDAEWSLPVLANKLRLDDEPVICAVLSIAAAITLILERPDKRSRLLLLSIVIQTAGELVGIGTLIAASSALNWIVAIIGIAVGLGGMLLRRRVQRWPGETISRDGAGCEVVAWSVIALGILISLPWLDVTSGNGLGMRLRVIAFVPMAICGAIVARAILRHIPAPPLALALGLALGITFLHTGERLEPRNVITAHPALVAASSAIHLPAGKVAVVQERHIAYMVAWYARAPISLRPETVEPDRRYRVMPLNFIGIGTQLERELLARKLPIVGVHPLHPNGMVVVPEATWRAMLDHITGFERIRLDVWPSI